MSKLTLYIIFWLIGLSLGVGIYLQDDKTSKDELVFLSIGWSFVFLCMIVGNWIYKEHIK